MQYNYANHGFLNMDIAGKTHIGFWFRQSWCERALEERSGAILNVVLTG